MTTSMWFALITALIWVVSFAMDKRKLRNGVYFMISYLSFFFLLAEYANVVNLNNPGSLLSPIFAVSILFIILPFIVVPLFILFFGFILVITAVRLIRNEGRGLQNFLGLLFSLLLFGSIYVYIFKIGSVPPAVRTFLIIMLSFLLFFFFQFVVFLLAAAPYQLWPKRKKGNDYLIVLGAGLLRGREVTPLLASRIDKAIEYYHRQLARGGEAPMIILSGGKGSDEQVSEAFAMKEYAIAQGIPEEHLVEENRSTNTLENMQFSKILIDEFFPDKKTKGLFFTNNFHVFRSSLFARQAKLSAEGVGSKTKLYYSLNAFVREFIGIMYIHKVMNIVVFALTLLLSLAIILYTT